MSHDLWEWQGRIKAIEIEHSAMRLAADRLLDDMRRDPTIGRKTIKLRDVNSASDQLEGTYIIRLFAEFETGLRLFWETDRGREPPARTRDLIDGIAARRHIPNDILQDAHTAREYRNLLIHERDEPVTTIPIPGFRGTLCRFLSFLPPTW